VIVVGTLLVLAVFLVFGWIIFTEMLQHRAWRRRVASGDLAIVVALIEEALGSWRRARPPRDVPASLWAAVQGAQLVAVGPGSATVSTSAEPEFRTEDGQRVQVQSALDEAIAIAAKLVDMMLYDVPNLRLDVVRVDVYATFTGPDGIPGQRPILTTTAGRQVADHLAWDELSPAEVLARFETHYERGPSGQGLAIELPPVEGQPPAELAQQGAT
jgi:hypothetical protein